MSSPTVSVIIPAYKQADFLGEAIQSVLDQSYQNFEVIVVDDASPDHTKDVVSGFVDSRVRYIAHPENRMLPAARNTGIQASKGEIIALLDADDIFHPAKLQMHVDFLNKNPDVGVSYNARFELNCSDKSLRELIRPPLRVDLSNLVLGFPFSPSDMVLRRDWAFRVNLFDESYTAFSEDLDINCRLALDGCRFAGIDRALNYRRHHARRVIRNIPQRLQAAIQALNSTFSDPRCTAPVLALKDIAYANNYLVWAFYAFAQNETAMGQEYIQEAVRRNPSLLTGNPPEIVRFLMTNSIQDDTVDPQELLCRILDQLPAQLAFLSSHSSWAVAYGYLLRGALAMIWGQPDRGRADIEKAATLGAVVDDYLLRYLADQLISFNIDIGDERVRDILQNLRAALKGIGGQAVARQLGGYFWVNRAFKCYYAGLYPQALDSSWHAVTNDPKYLANRGVLSIFSRSVLKTISS